MPKIKTHKASAKRFKRRGSGSLKRRNAYATHLLGGRSTKRKRAFRKNSAISSADMNNVRRALNLK
ncbi:MAG: 50S ribosomal protein L35 [Candidatus Latescibacteria bacterium]|jgi:large subunit ribosomal protein L35|nr:50S ribosomal protein L35 [Candidatus Latescibacterota bacterium]